MNNNQTNNQFPETTSPLEFTLIQLPTDNRINAQNVRINCLSPAVVKKGSAGEKELIERWNAVFPTLGNLKKVQIDVYNQEIFDGICTIPNLEELIITSSNFTDLSALKLLKNLNLLELYSNSKLTDVAVLSELQLKYLRIESCFSVSNYDAIGNCKTLIGLAINGDWTAPKNLKLHSIKPFENLDNLIHLNLEDCSVLDKSFESILKMEKLKRFDYLMKVEKKTIAQIQENHKNILSGSFFD